MVIMIRSSASVNMKLCKMRVWSLWQYAVTLPLTIMADIILWSIRGIRSKTEELQSLCKQYKPQIMVVQECQLRENKLSMKTFFGITNSSADDRLTGGVSYICLYLIYRL